MFGTILHCTNMHGLVMSASFADQPKLLSTGRSLSLQERYTVTLRMSNFSDAGRRYLQQPPNEMDIALGMKVMVTENMEMVHEVP